MIAVRPGLAEALREAAFWRLAGLLFERPRASWREEIGDLARELKDDAIDGAARASLQADEGAYLRLLGPGGAVSPREVAYGRLRDPGRTLAELSELYAAFAYHPRTEDPIDHITVETGFAGYLILKEAYAIASGDAHAAGATRRARDLFLESHLGPFAHALAARIGAASVAHLAPAARLLSSRLRDLGIPDTPPAPVPQGILAACLPDREGPLDCGACPGEEVTAD